MRRLQIILGIVFLCSYCFAIDFNKTEERLLLCYKHIIDSKTGHEKYDAALSALPKADLYKLYIDRYQVKDEKRVEKAGHPSKIFDLNEPGYSRSMLSGLDKVADSIEKPINLDGLIDFHDTAVAKVAGMKKGIEPGAWEYTIRKNMYNPKALDELYKSNILHNHNSIFNVLEESIEDKINIKKFDDIMDQIELKLLGELQAYEPIGFLAENISWYEKDQPPIIRSVYYKEKELAEKLQLLFDHYYKSIGETSTLDGRLGAIAELVRALLVAHIFPDGNGRTIVNLLMLKLLIENGIPPSIVEDPHIFAGGTTLKDLVGHLRQGLKNFLNESPELQKDFLLRECANVDFTKNHWLTGQNDYKPYFLSDVKDSLSRRIIKDLRESIDKALRENKVNEKTRFGILPLSLAILFGFEDLIPQLIKKDALLFGTEEKVLKNPVLLALVLGGNKYLSFILHDMSIEKLALVKNELLQKLLDDIKKYPDNDAAKKELERKISEALRLSPSR